MFVKCGIRTHNRVNESALKTDALNRSANLALTSFFISPFFRSSTGKSTLIKQALASVDPKVRVYLFNVRSDEVEGYQKYHAKSESVERCSLKLGLDRVEPDSIVILEDIICLKKKDEECLRVLLNYRAHHDRLRVICVGHMLFRNSLLTLVPLFNYIVFTLNNAGRSLVRQAATYAFNLDAERRIKWVEEFSKSCLENRQLGRSFCFVDCSTVSFYLFNCDDKSARLLSGTDDDDDDDDDRKRDVGDGDDDKTDGDGRMVGGASKTRKASAKKISQSLEDRFASCFSDNESAIQARGLFSILSQTLCNEPSFRRSDLSVAFRQARKPGILKRVSVVDYASNLLDHKPTFFPSTDHLVLHRYLSEKCKIPKLFIKNRYFAATSLESSNDELEDDDDDDDDEDSKPRGDGKRAA